MSEVISNESSIAKDTKELCNCNNDLSKMELANEYNLPMANGDLVLPLAYVWNNYALAYYQMLSGGMNNDDCMNMTGDGLPTLNHMATSYNTEENHSNYGGNKKRKLSNTLDYDNFELDDKKSSKKARSDVRLKTQEKRLKDHNLNYESRESYNSKTKRISRVLVCLHDGCEKEFKKTRNLIIHSRVHTKIRPHVCKYCTKGFTQQCNLKKHIELHLNGTFRSEVAA